jgi:Outer membrane protein beta-barrel domain
MKRQLMAIIFLFTLSLVTQAQSPKKSGGFNSKPNQQSKFLDKQWWLGFKAGTNLSDPSPIKRYTVMTPTNYPQASTDKVYDSFNKTGTQATLEATFYYKGFSFSVQPTYRHSRFTYSNQYQWNNPENTVEKLILQYDQEQKLDYADFPLIVKYDILKGKIRPYVQAGIYYSMLINANKSVQISGTDYASGGTNQFSNDPIIVGAKDLFENYWGLMAGLGVNYNVGNIRFVLDASYLKGMSNITNVNNRYSNDLLAGVGEVPDDLNLNNIIISAGVLFPMRFLSNSFNTLDR